MKQKKNLMPRGYAPSRVTRCTIRSIKAILTNITYTGNLLFQKEYVVDPITKKSKLNHGELPQYFVTDTHEPIIDMETYEYVQAEMKRRKGLGPFANKSLNITCFTSKIRCGGCSKNFQRSARSRKRDSSYKMWICSTRRRSGNAHCLSKDLPEDTLKKACAVVLSLEEFDESVFSEQVDYIIAHYPNKLEFHFYDGRIAMHGKDSNNNPRNNR
ncbi:MAG: recombinase family protein [Oscillospiraceae bacterium]